MWFCLLIRIWSHTTVGQARQLEISDALIGSKVGSKETSGGTRPKDRVEAGALPPQPRFCRPKGL